MKKDEILAKALGLNNPDNRYHITVEDDKIITRVKWMDATFFDPSSVSDEVKNFEYVVKIHNNGKYSELDKSVETVARTSGGKFNWNKEIFVGKQITFDRTIGIGKDRKDDSVGIVDNGFYSEEYKQPVRTLLKEAGYKKKMGFTGKLFLITGIIVFLILIAAFSFVFSAEDKTVVTGEEFVALAEEEGYTTGVDHNFLNANKDNYEEMYIALASGNAYQIEWYNLKDKEVANNFFENIRVQIEEKETSSSSSAKLANYAWFKATTNDSYLYISRVEDTVVFLAVEKEFRSEAEAFIEKLGY